MDLGLRGRSVMISGGSTGIGLATAHSMAAEGANISLASRNDVVLSEIAQEIERRYGVQCLHVAGDLTQQASVDRWVQETRAKLGSIDILVNNAGIPTAGHFHDLDDGAVRHGLELKLFGYLSITRSVLPVMRTQKSGTIVNVIGVAASQPAIGASVGGMAGAALASFTKTLSSEEIGHGIRVVAVSPGNTITERYHGAIGRMITSGMTAEQAELAIIRDIPIGRAASAQEVADLVTYVASDRAAYMVGTTVAIDGGITRGI